VAPGFDGSFNLVFGYLNRNYEEEVDIPPRAENRITVGGESFGDKGQPTHFYARRGSGSCLRFVVPKDWTCSGR